MHMLKHGIKVLIFNKIKLLQLTLLKVVTLA